MHSLHCIVDAWCLWCRYYGGTKRDEFYSVAIREDGGLVVAGIMYSVDAEGITNFSPDEDDNADAIIVKYDDEGTLLEETPYFARTDTDLNDIVTVRDGYMVVGECYDSLEGFEFSCGSGECLRIIK